MAACKAIHAVGQKSGCRPDQAGAPAGFRCWSERRCKACFVHGASVRSGHYRRIWPCCRGSTCRNVEIWCRKLESREPEPRRDSASHQRPFAKTARGLPVMRWHYRLRHVALSKLGPQNMRLVRALRIRRDTQLQRRACVKMPDLCGINPVPVAVLARFQQEQDRGPGWTRAIGRIGDPCLAIPPAFRMGLEREKCDYVVCSHVSPVRLLHNTDAMPRVLSS